MSRTEQMKIGLDAARKINKHAAIIDSEYANTVASKAMDAAYRFLADPPKWAERVESRTLMYEAVTNGFESIDPPYDHSLFYEDTKDEIAEILEEEGEAFTRWQVMHLATLFCEKVEGRYKVGDRALLYLLWEEGFFNPDPELRREFEDVPSFRMYAHGKAMDLRTFSRRHVDVQGGIPYMALREMGVLEVGDLTEISASDLRRINGVGEVTVREIKNGLSSLGLGLKEEGE